VGPGLRHFSVEASRRRVGEGPSRTQLRVPACGLRPCRAHASAGRWLRRGAVRGCQAEKRAGEAWAAGVDPAGRQLRPPAAAAALSYVPTLCECRMELTRARWPFAAVQVGGERVLGEWQLPPPGSQPRGLAELAASVCGQLGVRGACLAALASVLLLCRAAAGADEDGALTRRPRARSNASTTQKRGWGHHRIMFAPMSPPRPLAARRFGSLGLSLRVRRRRASRAVHR
jgi:hypothetical protein